MNSPNPNGSSKVSVTPAPGHPNSSSDLHDYEAHLQFIYACKKNTHIHKNKIRKNKIGMPIQSATIPTSSSLLFLLFSKATQAGIDYEVRSQQRRNSRASLVLGIKVGDLIC